MQDADGEGGGGGRGGSIRRWDWRPCRRRRSGGSGSTSICRSFQQAKQAAEQRPPAVNIGGAKVQVLHRLERRDLHGRHSPSPRPHYRAGTRQRGGGRKGGGP